MAEPIMILLVEDNPADVELTKEHPETCKLLHELQVARDGEQAMAMLRRQGEYADLPLPDLVLLDLNMPRKDGREVLAEMKADPELKRIPVVILTSSQAESDIARSYDLQAAAYVVKPVDLKAFGDILRSIEDFWLAVVRFPPK